jgi:hypothetical protein
MLNAQGYVVVVPGGVNNTCQKVDISDFNSLRYENGLGVTPNIVLQKHGTTLCLLICTIPVFLTAF